MKQKNTPVLSFIYINEPHPETDNDTMMREMAFDEENIKKLVESSTYKSALYCDALKYIH